MKGATALGQSYNVELLSPEPARLWGPRLLKSLRRFCPQVAPLADGTAGGPLAFVHASRKRRRDELPQTWIAPAGKPVAAGDYAAAASQSWRFAEAPKAIAGCRHAVLVRDRMAPELSPRERLSLFLRMLSGVLEAVPCQAIYWEPSRQIVDPRRFAQAFRAGEAEAFLCGPLNLRLFRVDGSEGEMLMDTLGMEALGLLDLQCRFRGLEPREVAAVLYNTAVTLFEKGEVLEKGETVPGIGAGARWPWRKGKARAEPGREVIELDSGTVTAGA